MSFATLTRRYKIRAIQSGASPISEPGDVEFLANIVQEEPCLSFKDCSSKGPIYQEAEEHSTQVTLNYPQIVATRMLKQNLKKAPLALRGRINEVLAQSKY